MYEAAVFYVFGAILLLSGLAVITARNPVHGALFLVLAFFTASAIWLLLRAEFLAITLVVVYVGAVMVLFLFVVMMLDINIDRLRHGFWRHLPLAGVVAAVIVLQLWLVLSHGGWQFMTHPGEGVAKATSNTEALGLLTYTQYLYPLQVAGCILLVAIIAAIALTLRRRKDSKYQRPSQQVKVRREERVRLVQMDAERRQSGSSPAAK